jgi:hypothetical protein
MKRKRGWLLCPLIIVALLLCAIPAYADIPTIPHAFYGTLTISGSAAPVGTVVTAKVGGVQCGSITTTVAGQYGGSGAVDAKLTVSGEIATGATINFYAGGNVADQTYAFSPGAVTQLNLTVVPPPDTTAPLVTITALSPDPTNDNTPTFTGTATDTQSNISSVEYKVDSGSWIAATASDGAFDETSEGYTFTTAALSDGAHTVYVRATDAASTPNTTAEANYASDSFTIDTGAPSVTIVALSPDPTNDNTPTFTGTATDTQSNISSVEYKVDSGSWIAATASDGAFDETSEGYTFTTAALSDGAHTVYVRATDAASNTTAVANYASDSFTIDTGAPSVTIVALSPDPTTDNTPTFTGTATDSLSNISSVEYKVDSGSWTAATASDGAFDETSEGYTFTTAALSDGAHTVYVRATDAATNTTAEVNYASDSFTVRTVVPGDANGDGVVNAVDITKVERIIALLDAQTPGADANQDGNVNALDITKVEMIIVGLG